MGIMEPLSKKEPRESPPKFSRSDRMFGVDFSVLFKDRLEMKRGMDINQMEVMIY